MTENRGYDAAAEQAFVKSVLEHRRFFQIAATTLNPIIYAMDGVLIPDEEILTHDESKFSIQEKGAYIRRFHSGNRVVMRGLEHESLGFQAAVKHHYAQNKHHPEHWISERGYADPMPFQWVAAMVADWLAANRQYAGTWDFSPYLRARHDNKHDPKLHYVSEDAMEKITRAIGFRDQGRELVYPGFLRLLDRVESVFSLDD